MAFPPAFKTERPTSVAMGSCATTIAERARTGCRANRHGTRIRASKTRRDISSDFTMRVELRADSVTTAAAATRVTIELSRTRLYVRSDTFTGQNFRV